MQYKNKKKHTLVVGGTGMLLDVSLYLLGKKERVSVIGRSDRKHRRLVAKAEKTPGLLNPIQLDYKEYEKLENEMIKATERFGEFDLVVCWIHTTAPRAGLKQAIENPSTFNVVGEVPGFHH